MISQTVPSKIQAYLAAGRPIIASMDGEGARIVMEAEAGVACPAEDARALADAVLKLRDAAPEELEEMGQRGHSFYEQNFAPTLLAGRLADILSDLVASRLAKYTDSDLRK